MDYVIFPNKALKNSQTKGMNMSITRVFLGTQAPLPQLAAERLLSGQSRLPDLGNIIIAVPGSFAREKLEYHLAGIAGNGLRSLCHHAL